MIIVAGRIYVRSGGREAFLELSAPNMESARSTRGCLDFVVSADPLEPDRVNIYEAWSDRSALEAFRGTGPGSDIGELIVKADVGEYQVEAP